MVAVAASLLDVREATGHNDGYAVEVMLRAVEMPPGLSWCGAYVYTAMTVAGVELPGEARRYAWAPTWVASRVVWPSPPGSFSALTPGPSPKERGAHSDSAVRPGDVFGIYYHSLRRVGHVGLVRDWQGSSRFLLTLEGNTNDGLSRDGDGVYSKRRLKTQIYRVSRWTTC